MNAKLLACELSTDIVPYMYGELSSSASNSFENHLLDCSECTDEFASIANARYEVYEWKQLEFVPMPTPHIEIPYHAIETSSESWVNRLRWAFSNNWAVPAFAFAGLALIVMFGAFFVLRDRGTLVANSSLIQADNTAAAVPAPVDKAPINIDVPNSVEPNTPRPIRVGSAKSNDQKRTLPSGRPIRTQAIRTTAAQDQPRRVPTLNEFVEDEDTSLRLAELFDDIETSD